MSVNTINFQNIYKIYEIVLVDGKEATIRDIYNKTVRIKGEGTDEDSFMTVWSYRIHEKPWWGQDVKPERIQKLNGELRFEEKTYAKPATKAFLAFE